MKNRPLSADKRLMHALADGVLTAEEMCDIFQYVREAGPEKNVLSRKTASPACDESKAKMEKEIYVEAVKRSVHVAGCVSMCVPKPACARMFITYFMKFTRVTHNAVACNV